MDPDALRELLERQDGVVSRRQVLGLGGAKHDLDRLVRRRELTRLHPGVYLNHTGSPTWEQRAWAAVLYAAPAALYLDSAGCSPTEDGPVHVAIDAARRLADRPGVRIHRVRGLAAQVQWNRSPPRVRLEDTVLELAHRAGTLVDVIRLLTDAVNGRRTTVHRLREALARRPRTRRRRWITRLLDDLESGACSVLEHGYLTRVERSHGLPPSSRQVRRRSERGAEYRDAEYEEFGLVVELDGSATHDSFETRGRDADRDLDDQAAGRSTVRLRWVQVFERECRTARRVGEILQRRGWTGRPRPCGPDCRLDES